MELKPPGTSPLVAFGCQPTKSQVGNVHASVRPGSWGSAISEVYVDVANLDRERRAHLSIPGCCDGAMSFLTRCSLCCLLTAVLPAAILFQAIRVEGIPLASTWLVVGVLAGSGVLICFCSLRRTLSEVLRPSPPAPPAPILGPGLDTMPLKFRRILIIYNPLAGRQKASELVKDFAVPRFADIGIECECLLTEYCGHARELAVTCSLAEFDCLVAVGGDGTLHEVVNGMLARADGVQVPVGVIPLGSGNAFASDFRFAARQGKPELASEKELLAWAVDRIAAGQIAHIDVLEVQLEGRSLVAIEALFLGLFGEVDILAEPFRFLGPARLDLLSVWSILKTNRCSFKARIRGEEGNSEELSMDVLGLGICLSQHWTSTMHANPSACLDDGLAEMNAIPGDALVDDVLAGFLQIESGAHAVSSSKNWMSRRIKEVSFEFPGPGVCNIDGEIFEHGGKLDVSVSPGRLQVIVGKEELLWCSRLSKLDP